MSFCVAGVALCDIPTCLITCRKRQNWRKSRTKGCFCSAHMSRFESLVFLWHRRLYGEAATPHTRLYTPHSAIYTLDSTLYTLHFTLYTLHSTMRTPHFTFYTPHFALYTPHSTLYTFNSTLHTLHSTVHTPQFSL